MVKKVVFIHGWKSHPEDAWFKWLGKEIRKKGYFLIDPKIDYRDKDMNLWLDLLEKSIDKVDEKTVFVAHSLGGFVTLNLLEQKFNDKNVGRVILVAPWADINKKLNFDIINLIAEDFVCIFSDNDSHIPKQVENFYKENLDAEFILEKGKGHFSTKDSVFELPIVLKKIEEFYKG